MTYSPQVDYASKPGTPVLAADALKETNNIYSALNELAGIVAAVSNFAVWPTVAAPVLATPPPARALVTKEQCPFRAMVIGDIQLSPQATLPGGVPSDITLLWLAGQVVNQADYPELFARYASQYNTGGEAAGTFRLPKYNGRYLVVSASQGGASTDGITAPWAAQAYGKGGAENVTLGIPNIPNHSHGISPVSAGAGGGSALSSVGGQSPTTVQTTAVGGSQPFSVLNPGAVIYAYTRAK